MTQFKYNIFILLLVCFQQVNAQKTAPKQPKIVLLGDYFICKGCQFGKSDPAKKKYIEDIILQDSLLTEAAGKIQHYFTTEGDRFILLSKIAKSPPKTLGYIAAANAKQPSANGFGTYLEIKRSGNSKGGTEFFKLKELTRFLTDSVLVFDSLVISTGTILDAPPSLLGSFGSSYQEGVIIERQIPFNAEKQELTLSYRVFFGDKTSRLNTDPLSVSLYYYSADKEKVMIPGEMKVFFASAEEKEDMKNFFTLYRNAFPDWTLEEIADELIAKIAAKYKNACKPNFIEWLKSLK